MTLGICTPYNRSETTAAALRLADLALALSLDVRLLACGPIERGIHPFWDGKVMSPRALGGYRWAKGCTHFVWFGHQPALLKKSLLVAEKARQILVLLWHSALGADAVQELVLYDRIVCPLHNAHKRVAHVLKGDKPGRATWCGWDAGIEPVTRHTVCEAGTRKLYVPMDSGAMDEAGMFTVAVLDELLKTYSSLHVTVDCGKSWPRKVRKEVLHRGEPWNGRIRYVYHSSLAEQTTYLHEHDLTFIPSIRANFGMTALRSLACHVPVLAYDVSPFSELIVDSKSGLLIRCDVGDSWLGQIACPNLLHTVKLLTEVLEDATWLMEFRSHDWKLARRAAAFETFWRKELGA